MPVPLRRGQWVSEKKRVPQLLLTAISFAIPHDWQILARLISISQVQNKMGGHSHTKGSANNTWQINRYRNAVTHLCNMKKEGPSMMDARGNPSQGEILVKALPSPPSSHFL